jgi:hypothetical protein
VSQRQANDRLQPVIKISHGAGFTTPATTRDGTTTRIEHHRCGQVWRLPDGATAAIPRVQGEHRCS